MLWVSPTPADLNGSSDSIAPDLRSSRWIAAKPLFCDQTLPSTWEDSARTMLTWVWSLFISGGMFQVSNFSTLTSNLAIAPWYIMPSHMLPSLSGRSPSMPVGQPFLGSGTGYSVTLPVFGSSLPKVCSPKFENQGVPCASTTTSCGSMVGRGSSYSVMMAWVPRPFGRGRVLSEYSQAVPSLRLIELRNSACR